MKKPTGISNKEWAKYKTELALALNVMNKALDVIADANFLAGEIVERERIIKLLEGEKFIVPEGFDEGTTYIPIQQAIELIKGEQK